MASLRIPTPNLPLIERDVERDALRSAVRGGGGVVLFEAAAGLGKTALLDEGAAMAGAAGWHVRRAAPSPLERGLPFGVLRALLEAPTREQPAVARGAAAAAGALLLDGAGGPGEAGLMAMAHSVLWLCSGLATQRPLALVVDDAHWADRASLAVLAYLARRLEDLPLLVLVGTRVSCDRLSLLDSVRAAAVLHPAPLSAAGTAQLIRRTDPHAAGTACRDLHRAAAGNPWLLSALLGGSARDAVRRRMAELTPRDRDVAEALAVIGDEISPHVLAPTAGVSVGELATAFDGLGFAGLTRDRRFVHALVRDAIAAGLARGARERLHRAAAHALAAAGADAPTVATHLLECAPSADAEATRWLVAAADQVRAGVPDAHSPAARRDDDVPQAAQMRRGEASAWRGDEAVAFLRRALDEGAPGDDRAALLTALGVAAFDAGLPEACAWLSAAAGEGVRTDAVVGRLAAYGVVADDSPAALDAFLDDPGEHARQVARRTGDDPVLLAHRAWVALGRHDAAAPRLAVAALADTRLLRAADHLRAYELCARVLVATGHPGADDAIAALRAAAKTVGMRAAAANLAAEHALRGGRLTAAEPLARTALAFPAPFRDGALALLVHTLAERGATGDAHVALRSAAAEANGSGGTAMSWAAAMARATALAPGAAVMAPESAAPARGGTAQAAVDGAAPTSRGRAQLAEARARLALAEGDFAGALEHMGDGVPAALALAHLGRRAEAARVADVAVARAERLGAPAPIAAALHARAVAEPDPARRARLCERALALDPGGLEAVRLRLELGAALAYLGRRVQARDALRPALADADAFGATALSGRARRELVATGLRPRQAAIEGTASLTPRQRQICELAAVGKGNRVIAQELFLSIKTVETHLAAGYRKLGVNTRAELAQELAAA